MDFTAPSFNFSRKVVTYESYPPRKMIPDIVLLFIVGFLVLAAIFGCYAYYIRYSDRKLQKYVMELAKKRGHKLDLSELKRRPQPHRGTLPIAESCPVLIAEAGIVIP